MTPLQTIAFSQSFHCRPYSHWFRGGFKVVTGSECSNLIVRMRPERWRGRILRFTNENMRPERVRAPASSSLESPSMSEELPGSHSSGAWEGEWPGRAQKTDPAFLKIGETTSLSTRWIIIFHHFSMTSSGSQAPPRPTCFLWGAGFPKQTQPCCCSLNSSAVRGTRAPLLMSPGTPVPSLWYIVQGLQGIWVVTRTRWACGLGLLTCSSTHTSKKVITQALD